MPDISSGVTSSQTPAVEPPPLDGSALGSALVVVPWLEPASDAAADGADDGSFDAGALEEPPPQPAARNSPRLIATME
jgi:hypothetical protein